MKTRRLIAWTLAGLAVAGIIFALGFLRHPVTIHVRIAEEGGFMPGSIKARVGMPLRLRLIADDVEHTFAVGQYSMDPVTLLPGKPVDVTLIFDQPGTYTFYTTTPSSLNFWRVRGVIEVSGEGGTPTVNPPLYVLLGLELDEEHESEEGHVEAPESASATRGEAFAGQIPSAYLSQDFYVAHSPIETFEALRFEPALKTLKEEGVWDAVAYIWQVNTSAAKLEEGRRLYQANCVACHGENGAGDGQFAEEMKAIADQAQDEHGIRAPTDFSDAKHLLEAQPAKLHGLILRGGMGTGMPMWGSIFTDKQLWSLVAYLYSFQFDYQGVYQ